MARGRYRGARTRAGGRLRGLVAIAAAAVVAIAALPLSTPSAAASTPPLAPAVSTDRVIRFGDVVEHDQRAVLLVHGWLSTSLPEGQSDSAFTDSPFARSVIWQDGSGAQVGRGESASLHERLEAIPGVALYAFDYSANSSGWVGSNRTAENLADAIREIAATVDGTVDVVTHSMGGLALRYALAASPDLVDLVGEVVTVATPTEGSDIANIAVDIATLIRATMSTIPTLQNVVLPWIGATCNAQLTSDARGGCNLHPIIRTGIATLGEGGTALRAGSSGLRDLPDWPAGVSIHAIAGSASVSLPVLPGWTVDVELGDGLVAESSATAEATTATVIACDTTLEPGLAGVMQVVSGQVAAPPFGGACGHDAIFTNLAVVDAVLDALDPGTAHGADDAVASAAGMPDRLFRGAHS